MEQKIKQERIELDDLIERVNSAMSIKTFESEIIDVKTKDLSIDASLTKVINDLEEEIAKIETQTSNIRKSIKDITSSGDSLSLLEEQDQMLTMEIENVLKQLEEQSTYNLTGKMNSQDEKRLQSEILQLEFLNALYLQATNLIEGDKGNYFRLNPPLVLESGKPGWNKIWQI